MKKVLFVGLFCTLILTGCGGKTLTCTMSEEEDGMTMSNEMKFTFDKEGEKITKGSVVFDVEVDEEYAEYLDELEEDLKDEFEDIEDFADVKLKTKNNSFSVEIKYSTKDLSEDELEELYYADIYDDVTYEELKEELEDSGFTCK